MGTNNRVNRTESDGKVKSDRSKDKNKLAFNKLAKSKLRKDEKRNKAEKKKKKKDKYKKESVEVLEDDDPTEFSNFMPFDDNDEVSNELSNSFSYVGGNYSERIFSGDINRYDTDASSNRKRSLKSFRKIA